MKPLQYLPTFVACKSKKHSHLSWYLIESLARDQRDNKELKRLVSRVRWEWNACETLSFSAFPSSVVSKCAVLKLIQSSMRLKATPKKGAWGVPTPQPNPLNNVNPISYFHLAEDHYSGSLHGIELIGIRPSKNLRCDMNTLTPNFQDVGIKKILPL